MDAFDDAARAGLRTYERDPKGTSTGGQFTANPSGSTTDTATGWTPYGPTKAKTGKAPPPAPRSSSKFQTLAPGEQNDAQTVTEMQQLLTALGLGNLASSGVYDKATENAVSEAQRRLGIKPNGKANKALVDKMLNAYDLSPCVKRSEEDGADDIERGHPYPGQRYKHGWIPIAGVETRLADKLNSGKKLDDRDPDERRLHEAIGGWMHGGDFPKGSALPNTAGEAAHALRTDPAAETHGGLFLRTVAAAPPGAPTLYRGMFDVPMYNTPEVGETFDLGPTSFTRDRDIAEMFATTLHTKPPQRPVVLMRVEKGSRALRIDRHGGIRNDEKEHVSLGRYEVTGRKVSRTVVKFRGQRYEVPLVELDLRQVDVTDQPPTFELMDGGAS